VLRGWEGVRGELESKDEGSWFQARDQSGWGFATMSKTSAFQVRGFFLSPFGTRGYAQNNFYVSYKFKDGIFVCRLKLTMLG
jgi:hypothetical protein